MNKDHESDHHHESEESMEEMEFTRKKAVHAVMSFGLALVIIVVLIVVVLVLIATKPQAGTVERVQLVPAVQVQVVRMENRRAEIVSQGVVESVREVTLSAEVGGRVITLSPNLLHGAAVREGELLVEMEKADYVADLRRAEASLEEAKLQLIQEESRKEQSLRDWEKLGKGEAGPLVLHIPQLAAATVRVKSAAAEVGRSIRNVERTVITAPFAGKIREKAIEYGGILRPGSMVATLYSVDDLEVRLPLSLVDYGYLGRDEDGQVVGTVELIGVIGSDRYEWIGEVVRSDGEIDRATLSSSVIVKVAPSEDNPAYLRFPPVGLFVEATIPGRVLEQVVEIPRMALRGVQQNEVLVVDEDSTMQKRVVTIVRYLRTAVLVRGGLIDGDQVIVTRMSGASDKVKVEVVVPEEAVPDGEIKGEGQQ